MTSASAAATPWNVLWSSFRTMTRQGPPRPSPGPLVRRLGFGTVATGGAESTAARRGAASPRPLAPPTGGKRLVRLEVPPAQGLQAGVVAVAHAQPQRVGRARIAVVGDVEPEDEAPGAVDARRAEDL